jgi:hypothetical protein
VPELLHDVNNVTGTPVIMEPAYRWNATAACSAMLATDSLAALFPKTLAPPPPALLTPGGACDSADGRPGPRSGTLFARTSNVLWFAPNVTVPTYQGLSFSLWFRYGCLRDVTYNCSAADASLTFLAPGLSVQIDADAQGGANITVTRGACSGAAEFSTPLVTLLSDRPHSLLVISLDVSGNLALAVNGVGAELIDSEGPCFAVPVPLPRTLLGTVALRLTSASVEKTASFGLDDLIIYAYSMSEYAEFVSFGLVYKTPPPPLSEWEVGEGSTLSACSSAPPIHRYGGAKLQAQAPSGFVWDLGSAEQRFDAQLIGSSASLVNSTLTGTVLVPLRAADLVSAEGLTIRILADDMPSTVEWAGFSVTSVPGGGKYYVNNAYTGTNALLRGARFASFGTAYLTVVLSASGARIHFGTVTWGQTAGVVMSPSQGGSAGFGWGRLVLGSGAGLYDWQIYNWSMTPRQVAGLQQTGESVC